MSQDQLKILVTCDLKIITKIPSFQVHHAEYYTWVRKSVLCSLISNQVKTFKWKTTGHEQEILI